MRALVQVLLGVAGEAAFDELFELFFKGHLAALAQGAVSNFVLQAAIANARTTPQVSRNCFPAFQQIMRCNQMPHISL